MKKHMRDILEYLLSNPKNYHSPSKIGVTVTGDDTKHSAWASPKLLKLMKDSMVKRSEKGHYKITTKGRGEITALKYFG